MPAPSSAPARVLSFPDCVAIGVNGIIGSGIYLLLGPMAGKAGAASLVAMLACAALCFVIALCFAELSGMYTEDGGAFLYAQEAFGAAPGFVVGWMSFVEGAVAFAAVAVGFAQALHLPRWMAVLLIALLSALNLRGVKAGARALDVLAVLKVAPLFLLAVLGVGFLKAEVVEHALQQTRDWRGVGSAALLATFMLSGFEYTAVPASAAKNPRRAIPRAILASLAISVGLYFLLQWLVLSVVPELSTAAHPIEQAATVVLGRVGGKALELAATLSMLGFCAGSALVSPHYLVALGRAGFVWKGFERLSARGVPAMALLVSSSGAGLLALTLDFNQLVDLSVVALFAQYLPSALAVPVLRLRKPALERTYRVPVPWLVGGLAACASTALLVLAHPAWAEWKSCAEILGGGALVWGATWAIRRARSQR